MMTLRTAALACALAACGSLDDSPDSDRCTSLDTTMPSLEIAPAASASLRDDATAVTVRGTARHQIGLAIRRITVEGFDAHADSFNFGAWSAQVPGDVVRARLPRNAALPAEVTLAVVGFEPCGGNEGIAAGNATVRVEAPEPDAGAP